jgi:hypothetical protein
MAAKSYSIIAKDSRMLRIEDQNKSMIELMRRKIAEMIFYIEMIGLFS